MKAKAFAFVLVAVAVAGCGGGSKKIDVTHIENEIRPSLARQMSDQAGDKVTVDSLDCVANNQAMTAKCIADLSDVTGSTRVSISVDVDRDTGNAVWHVDG